MKSVFVLQHVDVNSNGRENVKMIGVYRSAEAANAARQRHNGHENRQSTVLMTMMRRFMDSAAVSMQTSDRPISSSLTSCIHEANLIGTLLAVPGSLELESSPALPQ